MEILGIILFLFVLTSLLSDVGASSTKQPTRPANVEPFKRQGVTASSNNSSPVTPSASLRSGTSSDDFCNKCGRRWRRWDNTENGGYWYSCSGYPRCDNTLSKQLSEKFCSNGHPRTTSNTVYTASGQRRCLVCRPLPEKGSVVVRPTRNIRDSQATHDVAKNEKNKKNTTDKVCRNGHRRTPENTYIRPDGSRECRICRRNARD